MQRLSRLLRSDRAQGKTEYVLLVFLVAIAAIGAVAVFGENIRDLVADSSAALSGDPSSARKSTLRVASSSPRAGAIRSFEPDNGGSGISTPIQVAALGPTQAAMAGNPATATDWTAPPESAAVIRVAETGNETFPASSEFTASTGNTYKVFQRGDIDWDQVRTAGDKRFVGKTNAEAGRAGLPPQLRDGNFATLHHSQQNANGPLFEASTRYHNITTAREPPLHPYRGDQHPDNPLGRGPGSRREDFQRIESPEYWKWREQNRSALPAGTASQPAPGTPQDAGRVVRDRSAKDGNSYGAGRDGIYKYDAQGRYVETLKDVRQLPEDVRTRVGMRAFNLQMRTRPMLRGRGTD
jgi:Flp pilus assembly pilin Flp